MKNPDFHNDVFINCPFDNNYKPLFEATIFTVHDCGFRPRCALEARDGTEVRITKIFNLIASCKYGIHDISRTDLDETNNLPRFNMPLELGIFLGAKKFGTGLHKKKNCLILEKEQYRYQEYISDISGQDVYHHNDNPEHVVKQIRDWLANTSERISVPSSQNIWLRFLKFKDDLPQMCESVNLDIDDLIFRDISMLISAWLETYGKSATYAA